MICSQCNKEFTPTHNVQKYCSKKCAKNKDKERNKIRTKKYRQSVLGKKTKGKYFSKIVNKNKRSAYSKKNYQLDKSKERQREYEGNKRKSDPIYKIAKNSRSRISKFLKVKNFKKTNKTFVMVGCSPVFLKKHLEKQFHRHPDTFQPMNWKNHTLHGWHIDHIIPLDSAKTPEDVEKLMHYTNLQPMWATYNLKKGNKII